jgi:anionic cell wall polymer biosynthesis LytR-Cps2A-Psr (LCP) family protein
LNRIKFDPGLLILAIMAIILIVGAVVVYFLVQTDSFSSYIEENKEFAQLIIVKNDEIIRYSHLLIANTETGRFSLYDIPPNLGSIITALDRVDAIERLYFEKDPQTYANLVSELYNIDIPFIWNLDYVDLSKIADLLSGIPVFLIDPLEEEESRIPGGTNDLDGEKLIQYIAFHERDYADINNLNRMWALSKSLLRRMAESQDLIESPSFREALFTHLDINFDDNAKDSWYRYISTLDYDTSISQRSFGTLRRVETQDGMKELLFPHAEGRLLKESVQQILVSLASEEFDASGSVALRLEIQNGTAVSGLARRTKDLFESFGYNVIRFRNADIEELDNTVIVDHRGNPELSRRVGELIQCSNFSTEIDLERDVDVTIILGKDFDGYYVK